MLWLGSGLPVLAQNANLVPPVMTVTSQTPNRPLEPPEIRQVIDFMIDLDSKNAQMQILQMQLDQEKAFEQRQNDLAAKELDLEKQAAALAQHQADIEKERADNYQSLFKEATKKIGGFGCSIKKIFTLGLGKCI